MRHLIYPLLLLAVASIGYGQKIQSSVSYKPAAFEDSDRLAKLTTVFPAIEKMYREHAEKNHFPALVFGIVADGKLIFSGASGTLNTKTNEKATTRSQFRIASMTKSFTAMAIMRLQEEGKLNVSDAAAKHVPEMGSFVYPTGDTGPITIHHLLTMTAGFPEDNPWGDRQLEDTDTEFLAFLKGGVSFSTTPGQQFEYSNLGYAILGNIITRVSGMPYQEYITRHILQPLGMNNTYWEYTKVPPQTLALGYRWEDEQWKEEPMLHDGAYGAMGGLITSIEDFHKYVSFHLSAYPIRNDEARGPVKRSSVREMHKPYMPALYADAKSLDGAACPVMIGYAYGLGYRQDCKGKVRVSHSGGLPGFGSEYRFYPEYGVGVMSFSNRTYGGTGGVNQRVLDTLVHAGALKPRVLPASDILNKRKDQLVSLLPAWDEKHSREVVAENFFLDLSRDRWIKQSGEVFDKAGKITSTGPVIPENQLRGYFIMKGEKGEVRVYFTLSPEKDPKVQYLELEFVAPK